MAEKSSISNLLNSLSSLNAKAFVSEEKNPDEIKKYGLDNPAYKVSLLLPVKNEEIKFSLQKTEDKVYATTSHSSKIIEVEDSILADIEKEASELREKEVADFYSWEANKIQIKKGDLDLTAVKDEEGNWTFEAPIQDAADKSKIEDFIRKIEGLEAVEFIDPPFDLKIHGLEIPKAEIKIRIEEDEEKTSEVIILVGTEDKEANEVVLKNVRFDYLFKTDSGFLEDFPLEIKDWQPEVESEQEKK